jgi:polyisoprenoid-binding protein YceI
MGNAPTVTPMDRPTTADQLPGWTFDPELTIVAFSAQRMGIPWVNGVFKGVRGKLHLNWDTPLATTCRGEIDARRLLPGHPRLNTELRTADFLDVENHPRLGFAGRLVEQSGADEYEADAQIAIRGVTRQVRMNVTYLGQWRSPFWVGDERIGALTRVGLRAGALIMRDDLGTPLESESRDDRNAIEITLNINAILDSDLRATGAIEHFDTAAPI